MTSVQFRSIIHDENISRETSPDSTRESSPISSPEPEMGDLEFSSGVCEACLTEVVKGIKAACGHVFHSKECLDAFDGFCPIDRRKLRLLGKGEFEDFSDRRANFFVKIVGVTKVKNFELSIFSSRAEILDKILKDEGIKKSLMAKNLDHLKSCHFDVYIASVGDDKFESLNEGETPWKKGCKPKKLYNLNLKQMNKKPSKEDFKG